MHRRSNQPEGTAMEVFLAFLRLGLTSFGGPVAHLGYYREALVARRKWLDDAAYADLVALCQFLPGPASSQTGFALGLMRAGWAGAIAAFLAFTLPSALLLLLLAMSAAQFDLPVISGVIHGLKIVAVAIVAQAVWGMAQNLCPDFARRLIAIASGLLMLLFPGSATMVAAILAAAIAGMFLCPGNPGEDSHLEVPVSRRGGIIALAIFLLLIFLLPLLANHAPALALADSFYRTGALVFGGGHVVLPLLEAELVSSGRLSQDSFLAGYAAAQAVPGPLFSFAAWCGALMQSGPNGVAGAMIALAALFLPGFLLLIAALPFWSQLRKNENAQAAMHGANAAVVGILGAALFSPVATSALHSPADFFLALLLFAALMVWRAPAWCIVLAGALFGGTSVLL